MTKKNILVGLVVVLIIFILVFLVWYYIVNNKDRSFGSDQDNVVTYDESLGEDINSEDLAARERERLLEKQKDDAVKNSFLQSENVEEKYITDDKMQRCSSENAENCLTSIVMKEVANTKDITLCNNITIDGDRDLCINQYTRQFARESGNATLCDALDEQERAYCLLNLATAQAIAQKSLAYCYALSVYQEDCIITAASIVRDEEGDRLLCGQIQDKVLQTECNQ